MATYEICECFATPGLFGYFSKNKLLKKIKDILKTVCQGPDIGIYLKI